MRSKINRINRDKTFGFIRGEGGKGTDYFFHLMDCLPKNDFHQMEEGDEVEFEPEETDKGLRARQVIRL